MPKVSGELNGGRRSGKDRRIETTSKATGPNPKDVVGSVKAAMLLFPPVAQVHAADAMMDGAGKYDPYNWRAKDIIYTSYLHAAIRHVLAVWEGEECASDSMAKHLGHAIATLGIVLDAQAHGCLIDDRPISDGGVALREAFDQVVKNEMHRRQKRQEAQDARVVAALAEVGHRCKTKGARSGRCSGKRPNQSNRPKVKK